MGAVKDLVDLITQLSNSIEDRKFAAELREIQGMIGGIQSEHAALHEHRIKLMTENAELKQQMAELQQQLLDFKNQESVPNNKLPEEAQSILLFLARNKDVTAIQIAHNISLDPTRVEYWVDEFAEKEMACPCYIIEEPTTYSIGQKGRAYLIANKLI
jgi:predicted nuclease with TOPRIM domain